MSDIRRQSIISTIIIYVGFAVGVVNTYFFTKEGLFSPDNYGLISIFIAVATTMQAFGTLAMPAYIFKFYPYYSHNLPARKNDMPAIALVMGCIGFLLVMLFGIIFQDFVIRKYGENAPDFVKYYYWSFPFGFGLTIYMILQAYGWSIHKAIVTNFLKEVVWRVLTSILIALFVWHVITDFSFFIKLYSFTYIGIAVFFLIYLIATRQIHFTFKISKVTRRYFKKILSLCIFMYSGLVIMNVSLVFDSLVIASVLTDGLKKVGVFSIAQLATSIIEAPQRAIIASSVAHLAKSWKDKDLGKIQRIYQRSSINMLLFATGIYFLILLNYNQAIITLGIGDLYLLGFNAFIFLGLTKVVDLGCGVNAQIIATSTYWRFELISGIVLLCFMLPLSYLFAKKFDIMGPAIANLISVGMYNAIRIIFLWKKFKIQPFNKFSVFILLSSALAFAICYLSFDKMNGFPGMIVRSVAFVLLYGMTAVYFKLSPDIQPVWNTVKKRLRIK